MQNIIIGTAGHIDHGKTTLIKALTGRSTDKLQEEIKRGISINLGFTYFDLPSGSRAGIVDVPGHERFIKNMLAGAAGIDVVLLTVAANEGVKPQTIEHVDILNYLDIKDSIIVLTKCSLADETMLELVKDDIREQLSGALFGSADIIEVDSLSGSGLDRLIGKIDEVSRRISSRNAKAASRLNIDRVFSLKGFGTVVTGTLSEGAISVGDELSVYPKGLKAKIRGVQVHDQAVETAYAGQRTALNISNLKRDELVRGDVLAQPGTMRPSDILDVKLSLISHSDVSLKLWDRVRVYLGASEVLARVVPLDCDRLEKGGEAYCQLRLEKTAAAKKGDKFVIRTFSPLVTIGGGTVIDPSPKKHGKADKKALEALRLSESGGSAAQIEAFIRRHEDGVALNDVCLYASTDADGAQGILEELAAQGSIVKIGAVYLHFDTVYTFNEKCLGVISDYHEKYPLRRGISKEELKTRLSQNAVFDSLLKMLEAENEIKITDNSVVALSRFSPAYTKAQLAIKEKIEKELLDAGFSPPALANITEGMAKASAVVVESLIGESIVMLDKQTAMHKTHYERARSALLEHMKDNQQITLAEFRDLTASSRKYAMLLLESFDKSGLTIRTGEARSLKRG